MKKTIDNSENVCYYKYNKREQQIKFPYSRTFTRVMDYPLCKCKNGGTEGESDGKHRVTVQACQRACKTVLTEWEFKSLVHLQVE